VPETCPKNTQYGDASPVLRLVQLAVSPALPSQLKVSPAEAASIVSVQLLSDPVSQYRTGPKPCADTGRAKAARTSGITNATKNILVLIFIGHLCSRHAR
jgi:hypothetical protein